MDADISVEIAQLRLLSRPQLLESWQRQFGKTAPAGIRRELMIPFLAYRMQENQYGGLKSSTRTALRRIARSLESNPSRNVLIDRRIKPGTRLCRQWRGEMHEVLVRDSGYEYRGVSYASLSELAEKITGTRWSGPAFFGLKKAKNLSGTPDD